MGPFGLCLDSDIRKRNISRVNLHSDEPRVRIDTRWITTRIGVAAPESSYFLAVEADNVVLIVYPDFVVMPALRCEILVVLIVLLPRPRAERFYFVNGPVRAKNEPSGSPKR